MDTSHHGHHSDRITVLDHSATLDGQRDALCTSALLAVKVKGRHGDNYHAEGLESHFARDARHYADVSAADSLTHSLPTLSPHMCLWHTCVPACVRGMCAAACLDTHFHRHMPRHTHAMNCTCARACIGHPSVRLLLHLLDATHALMLIRHHANRHHVLLARLCHVRSAMCPTQVPSGVPSDLARCDRCARLSAKRAKLDDESAARRGRKSSAHAATTSQRRTAHVKRAKQRVVH